MLVSKEGEDIKNILLQAHVVPYEDEDSERCISQSNGPLVFGLRAEVLKGFPEKVFSFEAKHLLMVIQIPHMLVWLDYRRWKFKFFSTVLWSVESFSGIYDVQGVQQLVEHERRPTKLQQNFKWQVQAVPFQSCTSTVQPKGCHLYGQSSTTKTVHTQQFDFLLVKISGDVVVKKYNGEGCMVVSKLVGRAILQLLGAEIQLILVSMVQFLSGASKNFHDGEPGDCLLEDENNSLVDSERETVASGLLSLVWRCANVQHVFWTFWLLVF